MDGEKVLIVEPEAKIAELAVIKLSNAGYLVVTAADGEEAIQKAVAGSPDIVIINPSLVKRDGIEVCGEIRQKPGLENVPIILLVDQRFDEERFKNVGIKINDFLIKPFSPKTLLSRVNALVTKTRVTKFINPLTELPGRVHLQDTLGIKIAEGRKFNLIFCDIKRFKIYNKIYGYEKGNEVIKLLKRIIQDELKSIFPQESEAYHLGADKFCILVELTNAEVICQNIADRFDREIPEYYLENDRARGGSVITNRRGLIEQWPIMTLAMAIVTNEQRVITSWLEAENIGHELLVYIKSVPGSKFIKDRRTSS
jgi:DNA-binding response OmpR family regulator